MLIYFVIFIIAFLLSYVAETSKNKIPRLLYFLLVMLAVLIPSILAGLRVYGIGTDTKGYMNYIFYKCIHLKDIGSLGTYMVHADVEPIFILVDFIVTRFTTKINVSYFVIELILLGTVYLSCTKLKSKSKVSVAYFIFLILYFNRSLNICRQTVAIAFIFLSLHYLIERKFAKFLITDLIAMGFHRIAIIIVPFYFFYNVFHSNSRKAMAQKSIFFLVFFGIIILFKPIVEFLISAGILKSKYLFYINEAKGNLSIFDVSVKMFMCFMLLMFSKNITKNDKNAPFYNMFFIISIFLMFLGAYFGYAQRLAYYFEYSVIFLITELVYIVKSLKEKIIMFMIIIALMFGYSYICYDYFGWDETVPYKSIISKL